MTFEEFVKLATGFQPYPYQRRIADEGYPELLQAPTGSGKTVAAVLPWLWRRRFHSDQVVRSDTPRWLVVALPLRTLVHQMEEEIPRWLESLRLADEVAVHVLMGGRIGEAKDWTTTPGKDAIIIGSIDMLLSRALNRGYAASRFHWPIDFGAFNNDVQWVFDEVQLMGPALSTSRQIQAFRDRFGTVGPSRSMWMSATVRSEWLSTIDSGLPKTTIALSPDDRTGPLGDRVGATRHVAEWSLPSPDVKDVAEGVVGEHRLGTRTIVMVNTVSRAQAIYKRLLRLGGIDVTLVHSRFRPADRSAATRKALDDAMDESGRIVVTTQAFEAGIDVTCETLITEVAPWASIVQRAGRCNRYGESDGARLLWYEPVSAPPYDESQLERAIDNLRSIEDQPVTGEDLGEMPFDEPPVYQTLRRRDLLELFDTAPSLTGDDVDISSLIRDGTDSDVFLAWREFDGVPSPEVEISRSDLCSVPIGDAKKFAKGLREKGRGMGMYRFDPSGGRWRLAGDADLTPGRVFLVPSSAGGYTADIGWNSKITEPVPQVAGEPTTVEEVIDGAIGDDRLSFGRGWVTLEDHLADTGREVTELLDAVAREQPGPIREAVVAAARLHDVGKAHPAFQEFLRMSAGQDEEPDTDVIWAKSSNRTRARHKGERRNLRHELVSMLILRDPVNRTLLGDEADLVLYLVAAHHGRVRLAIRSARGDGDLEDRSRMVALGVHDGEKIDAVRISNDVRTGAATLDLSAALAIGGPRSWAAASLHLVNREDLGPFRLGWMEAVVRLSDWLASANPSRVLEQPAGRVNVS